jgi:epoxide hydrolase 4
MTNELVHRQIFTNGVQLHAVCAGPEKGPLVVLLHGFPEFWYCWRHQIPALAAKGFYVVAPDQRGYGSSDKPGGVKSYSLDVLTDDIAGLIRALGREKAHVVGHDWGGAVAWFLAVRRPEQVERLAILNCPHPKVMDHHLKTDPKQIKKSWYMFFFQVPFVPERMMMREDGREFAKSMARTGLPGSFTDDDLERYMEAWRQPGAPTGMINWYRAMLQARPHVPKDTRVRVPTHVIWGSRDYFLREEMAMESVEMCDQGRLDIVPEATHWVQHDKPERVNELLLSSLH